MRAQVSLQVLLQLYEAPALPVCVHNVQHSLFKLQHGGGAGEKEMTRLGELLYPLFTRISVALIYHPALFDLGSEGKGTDRDPRDEE